MVAFLTCWIDSHWSDFNTEREGLRELLSKWHQEQAAKGETHATRVAEGLLYKIQAKMSASPAATAFFASLDQSEGYPHFFHFLIRLVEKGITFSDISALEFARQLTLYQQYLWQQISSPDIIHYKPPSMEYEPVSAFGVNSININSERGFSDQHRTFYSAF